MPTSGFDSQQGNPSADGSARYEAVAHRAMQTSKPKPDLRVQALFENCLLDNIRDGIIFTDSRCRILKWSQSIEVMSGTSYGKAQGQTINSDLLNLHDTLGKPVPQIECPFGECIRTGRHVKNEFHIVGRSGRSVKTYFIVAPVKDKSGSVFGAVALIQDLSVQNDLQRQLKDLYAISMLDPLTQVANRAEFERMLEEYVKAHKLTGFPCSLIICDIDFFKQINDNYGHHIGDQALISFAQLLKKFVRQQDVVARYGGEEFVILCANCNRASGVERAEEIRATLNRTPQQMLNGKCITASFGVSELKLDDTSTELFVRADQALLNAKETGRNRVVSADIMGDSDKMKMTEAETTSASGVVWKQVPNGHLACDEFRTTTPMSVLVEKVRGYTQEVDAEIIKAEDGYAVVSVPVDNPANPRKKAVFDVGFEFHEAHEENEGNVDGKRGERNVTYIRVTVVPGKKTGWFSSKPPKELVPGLMSELRRYMMLSDEASAVKVLPAATKPGKR